MGTETPEPGAQAAALTQWQERREAELEEADRQLETWDELQGLLGGRTLDELASEADHLREEARERAAGIEQSAMAAARNSTPDEERLRALGEQASDARSRYDTARGELTEFEQGLPDVAEAEETLAAARERLDRVERLDRTLGATIKFLEQAEDRVHRDIAPVLSGTVREWLPRVTGGRYTDCLINPQSLAVEVLDTDGRWRQAALLSHGTAEQVYLLLRLALARHLVKPDEVCPLILDDAVTASDAARTREVLDALLAVSEETQVILFTHEDGVRDWARERSDSAHVHLIELDHSSVA